MFYEKLQVKEKNIRNLVNTQALFFLILGILLSYVLISISTFFKFLTILTFIALINYLIKRFIDDLIVPMDIELSTLATVVFAMTQGFMWGFFAGTYTMLISYVLNDEIGERMIFNIISYFIAASIAVFLIPKYLILGGIAISIFINILVFLGVIFIGEFEIFEGVVHMASNIPANIFFFTHLAIPLLRLIA